MPMVRNCSLGRAPKKGLGAVRGRRSLRSSTEKKIFYRKDQYNLNLNLLLTCQTTTIIFCSLTPEFIGHHLADVGEVALTSVGAYQIEGRGIQLIENIKGDFFSIIGMPLLPLLKQLRSMNILEK